MLTALLQEIGKLSKRGRALWSISLLFSSALFVFGVFVLVTQDMDANIAISVEFNTGAEAESVHADGSDIFPAEDFFSTYSPTNTPTLSPSTIEVIAHNNADTYTHHHPSMYPSTEPSKEPVASPISTKPSMHEDHPSEEPTLSPFMTMSPTMTPTTLSPTLSPLMSPILYPTNSPTSSSRPTTSVEPTTTNLPTQIPLFPTHNEPDQPLPTFFNYNTSESSRYGPHSWGNVTVLNSTAQNYWHEFGFVTNNCGNKGAQSPIDVCTQPVRHCEEYHEFRAKVNCYCHVSF